MTRIEQQANWIASQRKKVISEINSLMTILTIENLSKEDGRIYDINADFSTSGNCIGLRIYKDHERVETIEIYCLNNTFDDSQYITFNKQNFDFKVKELITKIRKMQALATKYSKLNQEV